MRIVIADDGQAARNFLRAALTNHQIVGIARDGEQAVALCKEHRPDLAILDIAMPRKTGLTAAQEIAAGDFATHVIILSSNMQGGIVDQCKAAGAHAIGKVNDKRDLHRLLNLAVPEFQG